MQTTSREPPAIQSREDRLPWGQVLRLRLFGRCRLYYILAQDLADAPEPETGDLVVRLLEDPSEVRGARDEAVEYTLHYSGGGALGFGGWVDGELATACWLWDRATYLSRRSVWPPPSDDTAKLVGLATAVRHRGKGLAPRLIRAICRHARDLGYRRLYARIYASNKASLASFRKAGWRPLLLVLDYHLFGSKYRLRFSWRQR